MTEWSVPRGLVHYPYISTNFEEQEKSIMERTRWACLPNPRAAVTDSRSVHCNVQEALKGTCKWLFLSSL